MTGDHGRIRAALNYIPAHDRETWVRMAMAVKADLAESGFDVWNEWSQQADSYNAADARSVWRSINGNGKVTVGTLFHEAKANGWHDDGLHCLPTPEEIAERRRVAVEREAQEEVELARQRAETADNAAAIWRKATPARADHPYLQRKEVAPVATLREIDAGAAITILGYTPQSRGELLTGRLLVVPVKVGDALSTAELIDESGRKTALAGHGTKAGGYWAAQSLPGGNGADLTLLIAEGVADALSSKQASGDPAIATLSDRNFPAVAREMRDRYPAGKLVLIVDLVTATGELNRHTVEAARSCGGLLAIPPFGAERPKDWKDMNDVAVHMGLEAVRRAIANAKPPEVSKAQSVTPNASADHSDGWPEPQPLAVKVEPEPYPLDALPDTIRAAVIEVQGFTKAPVAMVASSALSALSLAIQAHYDVQRADKLQGPVALFLLTLGDSGERKSTCDGFFTKGIRDYEETQAEVAKSILKDHHAAIAAWDAKCHGVKDKIRQLAKGNKSTASMEAALRDLEHDKPEPPRIPRLLYADATPEALAYGLAKQWPSGGVVSAEAGVVFGSHGMGKDSVMRNLGLLNQLWDGTSLAVARRSTESFTVRGARLTVALQVQEPTLREFFTRSGALARGTGFLARFLFASHPHARARRPWRAAADSWS